MPDDLAIPSRHDDPLAPVPYSAEPQSVLGVDLEWCRHQRSPASCVECLYSDPATRVVADLAASEAAPRIARIVAKLGPGDREAALRDVVAEVYLRGHVDGSTTGVTAAVIGARSADEPSDAELAGAFVAMMRGQVSRVDVIRALGRWARAEDRRARGTSVEGSVVRAVVAASSQAEESLSGVALDGGTVGVQAIGPGYADRQDPPLDAGPDAHRIDRAHG